MEGQRTEGHAPMTAPIPHPTHDESTTSLRSRPTRARNTHATPLIIHHHFAATPDFERQLHALERLLATTPAAPTPTSTPATSPDHAHLPQPAGDEPLPTPAETGGAA